MVRSVICCTLICAFARASQPAASAAENSPPETKDKRDGPACFGWRDARLGMFVHWGLYSGSRGSLGWQTVRKVVWNGSRITPEFPPMDYAKRLRPMFTPKRGFAKEWARLARKWARQYVVFTSKHHEGFALWDSKVTDFEAKDFTGRDLFKEIVSALRAEACGLGSISR